MKFYRLIFSIFIFNCQLVNTFAQEIPETRRIVIDTSQKTSFFILVQKKEIKLNKSLIYHCYSKDRIVPIQGGITGYLLNGSFETLYENAQLSEKGAFDLGLKNGVWKFWYKNGLLRRIENWKEGRLDGTFTEFDEIGNPINTGKYSKGELTGKTKIFQEGKLIETRQYRKGELLRTKTPTEKKKRAPKNEKAKE